MNMRAWLIALLCFAGAIIWGGLTWLRGSLSYFFSVSVALAWILRFCLGYLIFYAMYHKSWQQSQQVQLNFFGYPVRTVPLRYFIGLGFFGVVLGFFVAPTSWWFNFALGVLASSVIEELATRSPLLLLQERTITTVIAVIVASASAHAGMHWLFYPHYFQLSWSAMGIQFLNYAVFGFWLAIITVRTRRLEPAIIMHMASNLVYVLLTIPGYEANMLAIALIKLGIVLMLLAGYKARDENYS